MKLVQANTAAAARLKVTSAKPLWKAVSKDVQKKIDKAVKDAEAENKKDIGKEEAHFTKHIAKLRKDYLGDGLKERAASFIVDREPVIIDGVLVDFDDAEFFYDLVIDEEDLAAFSGADPYN